ncbi:unnamed protein product [Owenia fusiformis]|uniref:CARD domain-containing protein n=1 Tax=Owenia fusiformis TaxID=6347 RepID=A0A8S4NYT4_OWEFU|nr:unnamed protein product [Owenia fusiformis]
MKSNSSKIIMRGKVYDMILQTRGYLLQELDPEDILKHLSEQGAISERTEVEIRKCRSKDAMCEILLDVVMSKGHKEFTIFCDCLRQVGGLGHLADLLEVLDTLIETVTETHHGFRRGITPSYIESKCHLCVAEADEEDSGSNTPNFDIDISYYDNEGQTMRSVKEIAKLKQQERYKLASTVKSLSVEQLNRFIPVISVSFYNQCLNNEGLTTLADLLSKYNCIRELSIVKNHIGEDGMDQLGKALQKNHGLTKLDIRLNTIGDEGATSLQKALNENRTLKILNVTSTGLSGLGCNKLVQGLHKSTCLSELDVGFNDLRNEGCKTFAVVLANNCSLRNLRMRDNNIGKDGAILIFQSLRKNSRLTALDMSSNKLGDESVKCLSEVLLVNRGLRELNLENCAISSGGCPVLSRALKTNTALRILDLSMNQLCDSGATALSDGLKYNKTLTTLSMNMCSIGNIGFIPLLDSLMFNITLVTLKLCYNHIGEIPLQPPPAGKQRHRHVPVMGTQDIHVRSNELRLPPDRLDKPLLNLQEKYAELLSCNPELKILLWGNKLEDHWKGGIPETPKSIASCNF